MASPFALLRQVLRRHESAVIAFSGGVDSSLLAYVAAREIPRVLAVTAWSETYSTAELRAARAFARIHGIPHRVVRTRELADRRFRRNSPDRCYYCKYELFSVLERIRAGERYDVVMDATNADDLAHDVRPGHRAALRFGVVSPLAQAGLGKKEVRALSRRLGLATHNRPAAACLASRVAFGTPISANVLRRVARAEAAVRAVWNGFFRVRHDAGGIARLEVLPRDFTRFFQSVDVRRLAGCLHRLGYTTVTFDLDGYIPAGVRHRLWHAQEHTERCRSGATVRW